MVKVLRQLCISKTASPEVHILFLVIKTTLNFKTWHFPEAKQFTLKLSVLYKCVHIFKYILSPQVPILYSFQWCSNKQSRITVRKHTQQKYNLGNCYINKVLYELFPYAFLHKELNWRMMGSIYNIIMCIISKITRNMMRLNIYIFFHIVICYQELGYFPYNKG